MNLRPLLVVAALSLGLTGCGGSSSTAAPPASTPSPTASPTPTADPAVAAVTAAWESFFNPAGTVAAHVALLQNGARFRAELTANAKDPAAKSLSAKVTSVVITGTSALVTYDLLGAGGAVLLPKAQGKAVDVGGHWLVSAFTYCQLINLQNPAVKHPGCS